jgi:DNA-binding IclR family transcriptional regulator
MEEIGETDSEDRPRVEAVERSLLLLQCFHKAGEQVSLAVLAQRSGFYKSTILRLTASLVHMGFLMRDPGGSYRLGPELRRLGALSQAEIDLGALIRPVLQRLTAATQETASFYVADGEERICLYRVNSPRSARHHLDEGARHPLNSGAAGRILRLYGTPAGEATDETRAGWVVSSGERDPDLAAVAVPLWNRQDELLGALTVSGLIYRFTPEKLEFARRALLDAAKSLLPRLPPIAITNLAGNGTGAAS